MRTIAPALTLATTLAAALAATPALAQQLAPRADTARAVSLADAIALAERASPALRIARNAVLRAQGQRDQARSGFFPQIAASASYTRTLASQFSGIFGSPARRDTTGPVRPLPPPGPCDQYLYGGDTTTAGRIAGLESYARCASAPQGGIDFSRAGFGSKNSFNLGLTGSQALFTGGRLTGLAAAANAGRRAAEVEFISQRAQLTLDVTQAYYDAALADRLVAIADSTLAQTESVLRQTQLQQRVGNVSEFDLLRATVARDNQRPVVIQARSARAVAYLRLKQLLAVPLDQPLALTTPVEDSTAVTALAAATSDAAPDTTTESRAAVREAREAVAAQRGQLRAVRAERIPSLTLSSAYGRVAFTSGGVPAWADFRTNWTVTLSTSFPIFTGGRLRGDERIAMANLRDAQARLTQARQLSALDAREALNTLERARAAYAASAGTADQAGRAYAIAEVRYREGMSTQVELSDARNQLAQALVNRAQAARDLQVARVRAELLPDLPLQLAGTAPSAGVQSLQAQSAPTPAAQSPGQAQVMPATGSAGAAATPGTTPTTTGGQPRSNF